MSTVIGRGMLAPDAAEDFNWFSAIGQRLQQVARNEEQVRITAVFAEWLREVEDQLYIEARRSDPSAIKWSWDYKHFTEMQKALDRVTAGELRRVYFQIPIRHGKSEHNTIRYAVYRLERNPRTRIIITSYNQDKALDFSRKTRALAIKRGIKLNHRVDSASNWETTEGGGVQAFGAGAGIASVNADVIIIDDPIGKRDEAESLAIRNQRWDWLTNDLLARCEPHTAVLMTMSRWHSDDPAGRLRAQFSDLWHIVDLPGTAEYERDQDGNVIATDPLGRAEGEPLWPELRPIEWHREQRRQMLEYGYASLIQGRPRPREGGMFKWSWWKHVPQVPAEIPMFIRYWDVAGTEKQQGNDPDYTSGTLMGRTPDGRSVIVNVVRGQWSVAQRDAMILQTAREDISKFPGRVQWWFETQAGIGGKESTEGLIRWCQTYGIPAYSEAAVAKKETRATPLASAAESGNVYLVDDVALPADKQWIAAFKTEMAEVFSGLHDDQADSTSGAFNKLNAATMQAARYFSHRL